MNRSLKEMSPKEDEDHFPSLGKIKKTKKVNSLNYLHIFNEICHF